VTTADDPAERQHADLAALVARYARTTDPADFNAAIEAGDRLLDACGQDPIGEISVLLQLSGLLSYYCDATGDLAALARVAANGRRILELAEAAGPERTAGFGRYWLPGLRAMHARSLLFWYQSTADG
jgi:hypothetical protein